MDIRVSKVTLSSSVRKPYKVKLSSRTWSDVSKEVIVPIGPIFSKVDVGAIILKVKNET